MYSSYYLIFLFICQVLAIWPAPKSMSTGNSVLWIAPNIQVSLNGAAAGNVGWSSSFPNHVNTEQVLGVQSSSSAFGTNNGTLSGDTIVKAAVWRTLDSIFKDGLVPWKSVPRTEFSKFEPSANASKTYISSLAITQSVPDTDKTYNAIAGAVDESYNLTITAEGKASIAAVSSFGVLHALQSFTQLFYQHSTSIGSGSMYTKLAPIQISDAPKFAHRGLNMDVARNWYAPKHILRTIDGLAMNKFNKLHIHMTDSQSWPMEIPSLPELAEKGAYSTGLTYTPSDIKKIQTYAIERGVQVIIEFDMPGHTTSIGYSHPDLIAGLAATPWSKYCAEPPCGSLKLNSPAVNDFLQKLFADVLPRVQPYTGYFHTGGDEVNKQVYLLDDTVKSNLTTVLIPLIQKLVDRNHDQVRAANLVPIVWEEMLLEWNLTLGSDVLIQSWQSDAAVASIVASGHKAIAGNCNFWYLDCGKGQWLNFDNGQSFQGFYPFLDYCGPYKNWRLVYSYDPLTGVPANQSHLVVGGEVHIWSEMTDGVNLDDMVWPRASAAGEVLWSGRQDGEGKNRSQITAAPRLAEMRERMVNAGFRAGPVQMIYCTQNNATECAL